jgi:hypothetical protein
MWTEDSQPMTASGINAEDIDRAIGDVVSGTVVETPDSPSSKHRSEL